MIRHCVVRGKNIAFRDNGSQPNQQGVVVFLHGAGSSHSVFNELAENLDQSYRVLAPDLLGYGASESWPINEPYHWQYDVDVVHALLNAVDSPVRIVAHGYGAFLALETARQSPALVSSLLLAEPTAPQVLRNHPDPNLWELHRNAIRKCLDAVASGDVKKATSIYLKHWGNPIFGFMTPRKIRYLVQGYIHKMAKELFSLDSLAPDLQDYTHIHQPVLFVSDSKSREHCKHIISLLSENVSRSLVHGLGDVGYGNIFSKTEHILPVIQNWLAGGIQEVSPVTPVDMNRESLQSAM